MHFFFFSWSIAVFQLNTCFIRRSWNHSIILSTLIWGETDNWSELNTDDSFWICLLVLSYSLYIDKIGKYISASFSWLIIIQDMRNYIFDPARSYDYVNSIHDVWSSVHDYQLSDWYLRWSYPPIIMIFQRRLSESTSKSTYKKLFESLLTHHISCDRNWYLEDGLSRKRSTEDCRKGFLT